MIPEKKKKTYYRFHRCISSVIRQKDEFQNECFKKTKHTKFSEKRTFLTPWYADVPCSWGLQKKRFCPAECKNIQGFVWVSSYPLNTRRTLHVNKILEDLLDVLMYLELTSCTQVVNLDNLNILNSVFLQNFTQWI